MMATVERFRITVRAGIIKANSRPTLSCVAVRSSLASPKRCSSRRTRSKARMTRTPLSTSRVTWLTRSIFFCIDMNRGIARLVTRPMKTPITGIDTRITALSGTLSRSAMMRPPMAISGAMTTTLSTMSTTICTCCTSLVVRVMSEGVPKRLTSACEKPCTRRNSDERTSRPKPMDTLDPQYTAMTAAITLISVTTSMSAPTCRM